MNANEEIKTDEHGKRYIDGKNGKRWYLAPVMYHDAELARAMSALFFGRPALNPREQAILDLVAPILDCVKESVDDQMDEPTSFQGGEAVISIDMDDVGYEIAETIAEHAAKDLVAAAAPRMLEVLESVYHQLNTDSDLATITGAAKYAALVKDVGAVIGLADPANPQIRFNHNL